MTEEIRTLIKGELQHHRIRQSGLLHFDGSSFKKIVPMLAQKVFEMQ